MPKPIVVIYFPDNYIGGKDRNWVYEYMRYLNGEKPDDYQKIHWPQSDYWKDYYWFCFYKDGIAEPEFQVFYEKDFTEIQFSELKKLINNSLKQIKPKE